MSKHAVTVRRYEPGAILRRGEGRPAGRHRARARWWAASVRFARRTGLRRSGRAVLARFTRWVGLVHPAAAAGDSRTAQDFSVRSVLALGASAILPGVVRPRPEGARPRHTSPSVREVVERTSAMLRRFVMRAWHRGRELGLQWTVQARTRADAGMSTAEYAVGTIAACGFAALLWKVVTSAEVRTMLATLIQKALKLAG